MRQVLFVQGAGADVHDQWDDKLAESLKHTLGDDYAVRYPRMPDEADPSYRAWKAALIGEFRRLKDGAFLVGHSIGGAILLQVLVEEPAQLRPGALFFVAAPFIGEGGWPSEDFEPRKDLAERLPRDAPIFFYQGTKDAIVPSSHLQLYAKAIPRAVVRALAGNDHQLDNDMSAVARDIRSIARSA
jgi:hypothetical protein